MKLLLYALAKPLTGLFAGASFLAFQESAVDVELLGAEIERAEAVEAEARHLDERFKKHEHKHEAEEGPAPERAPAKP